MNEDAHRACKTKKASDLYKSLRRWMILYVCIIYSYAFLAVGRYYYVLPCVSSLFVIDRALLSPLITTLHYASFACLDGIIVIRLEILHSRSAKTANRIFLFFAPIRMVAT